MNTQKQSTAALRKRRQALLRQLPPLKAILRGSLIERYKRCGKPGCKCADGPGHGPKYYLSVSYPGLGHRWITCRRSLTPRPRFAKEAKHQPHCAPHFFIGVRDDAALLVVAITDGQWETQLASLGFVELTALEAPPLR